jgi:1,4-alpha-glucan branching enzyme
MKKIYFSLAILFASLSVSAQNLLSWTPDFPIDNGGISFTVDCSKGNRGLFNFEAGNSNNVYVHVGLITSLSASPTDWKYTKFTWGSSDANAHAIPLGNNKYQYSINNIRSFFGVPASEIIKKITVIFRSANGNLKQVNSDNSDMYIPVYTSGEFAVRLKLPVFEPRYIPWLEPLNVTAGSNLAITGVSSTNATLTLKLNGNIVATVSGTNSISANPVLPAQCNQTVFLEGNDGSGIKKDSFSFFIPPTTVIAPLPPGTKDGINYAANNTDVTLVLFAPNKTNVVVVGDFSNWAVNCSYQMNRTPDNQRYFITITGLTPGTVYRYQYLVDGVIKIADPYTELILDPANDQYISTSTFPNMPAYPTGNTTGIVSTFQTNAPAYIWTANNYTMPDKKSLVIYELLLRDFLASNNWQTLTDTLNYLKNLGINAIEVMPFNEFDGNINWGYSPSFLFAPDKYYGTKNALKKFIDEAHKKGIAVIMDAVLNHATGNSPLAQLYFDAANNRPAANSPFFNPIPTHPYNVYFDFNHESEATKYVTSRFIRHWLTEYKIDGFRWDLSKGFTQKVCSDIPCWNAYDASRVATWQRYYDSAQSINSNAYYILEHLANDDEEAALSNRGMLLWGIMTEQFNQNTMGYSSNSDLSRAYYKNRAGWTQPLLVTYAESHDEERIMYKNLAFGNSANPAHDVKNLAVALKRTEAMEAVLLLIPGPKMIWQFGELGYDHSKFECSNGTIPTPYGNEQCKLDPKNILWNYFQLEERKRIYKVIAAVNKLRNLKPATFTEGLVNSVLDAGLVKQYSVTHNDLSVVVVANFNVTAETVNVNFPSAGIWNNYIEGGKLELTSTIKSMQLGPGEYKIFINQDIKSGLETATTPPAVTVPLKDGIGLLVYPNPLPSSGNIRYVVPGNGRVTIKLFNYAGQQLQTVLDTNKSAGEYTFPDYRVLSSVAKGIYLLKIEQNGKKNTTRFFKSKS